MFILTIKKIHFIVDRILKYLQAIFISSYIQSNLFLRHFFKSFFSLFSSIKSHKMVIFASLLNFGLKINVYTQSKLSYKSSWL